MEAILFCGIQASGKTTFYRDNFLKTHVRISLDLLRTHNREHRFLALCLDTCMPFVVDRTNATKAERARYITSAKQQRFKVTGYYFKSTAADALERNNRRQGKEVIPEIGIRGTLKKLEPPVPN
jgi:predicted kinase